MSDEGRDDEWPMGQIWLPSLVVALVLLSPFALLAAIYALAH